MNCIASIALVICVFFPPPAFAQATALFDQIQLAIQSRDAESYLALVSNDMQTQSDERAFIEDFVRFGYTKAVLRLVDEEQDRLMLHIFLEKENESRFEAWQIKTQSENGRTLINQRRAVSTLSGLYRLRLAEGAISVSDAEFKHLDSVFRFKQGNLFPIFAGEEMAGIIFLGEGTLEFTPSDATEQQQLTLFCKQPRLVTSFDQLYIRSSGRNLQGLMGEMLSGRQSLNPDLRARAQQIANEINPGVTSVNIPLSEEVWYSRLQQNELYCQMQSPYGTLA